RLHTALRSAAERERLWADLAGEAGRADDAIRDLIAVPADAVPFLKDRLRPVPAAVGQRVAQLINRLDSDRFAERQRTGIELEKLQDVAELALRKALAAPPSPEVRRRVERLLAKWDGRITSPDVLRAVRAVEVLEHINTPAARRVLETLAEGTPEARLTQE